MTLKEWFLWVGVFVAAGLCVLVLRHRQKGKYDPCCIASNGNDAKGALNTAWIGVTIFMLLKTGVPLASYGVGVAFERGFLVRQNDRCALGCYKFARNWPLKKHPDRKTVRKCNELEKKLKALEMVKKQGPDK